jgi:hypothetical protein
MCNLLFYKIDIYCLFQRNSLIAFLLLLLLWSCNTNPLKIDVSHINIDLQTERLDLDFFDKSIKRFDSAHIHALEDKYGDFFRVYCSDILSEGFWDNSMFLININRFRSDLGMLDIQDAIEDEFTDLTKEKNQLTEAFKHYYHYFPDSVIPNVIFLNSGYNFAVYPHENHLGIGLEWFIGKDKKIIQRLPYEIFPNYIKDKMRREYLASDALKGWLLVKFYHEIEDADFSEQIIFYGKIMYLLDAMMPTTSDSIKMNYTSQQMDWVEEHEKNIWTYIVENDMLFSTDQKEIGKFVHEAPFTSGLPRESPPKVGIWLGWQMVRAHMKRNSELTIHDLIKETNYKKILKSYKPKK